MLCIIPFSNGVYSTLKVPSPLSLMAQSVEAPDGFFTRALMCFPPVLVKARASTVKLVVASLKTPADQRRKTHKDESIDFTKNIFLCKNGIAFEVKWASFRKIVLQAKGRLALKVQIYKYKVIHCDKINT